VSCYLHRAIVSVPSPADQYSVFVSIEKVLTELWSNIAGTSKEKLAVRLENIDKENSKVLPAISYRFSKKLIKTVHQRGFLPEAKMPIVVGVMVDISGREGVRRAEVGVDAKKSGKGMEVCFSITGYLPIMLEM